MSILIAFSLLLLLLLSSLSFSYITAQTVCNTIQPTYNATASEGNPFRGFFPYIGERDTIPFPYSMEYTYVALREIMTGDNTFSWTILDEYLADVATRHHQLVMRLYVDYPNCCPDGQYNTGIPAFLLTGAGAVTITRGGQSGDDAGYGLPDYSNPRLITAMEQAITALGARYDNDTRLAFIQVGLLGFWGEWHVWPLKTGFPSRVIQERILRAYDTSFKQTGVVVSADELKQWNRTSVNTTPTDLFRIGWHDDDFAKNTYQANQPNLADQFYTNLKARGVENRWKQVPIGGEIQPDVKELVFDPTKQGSTSFQPFHPAAAITHASWLLYDFAFDRDTNAARVAATRAGSLSLGYQFRISQIQFRTPTSCIASIGQSCIIISVTVENVGNAPFYYPLTLVAIIQGVEHTFPTSPNSAGAGTSTSVVTTSTTLIYDSSAPSLIVTLALRSTRTLPNTFIRWANAGINQNGALVVSVQSTCGTIAGTTPSPTEKCMANTNSGCSVCTNVAGCGWCDTTSSCVPGGEQGPSTATTCDARNWNYLSSTCTPVGTSTSAGKTNITANNVTAPPMTDSCQLYTSAGCQSCTSFRACGWCTSTRTCRTVNSFDRFEGSADGACPRQLWYPDTSYCISGAPANGTVSPDRTSSAYSVAPFYVAIISLLVVLAL